MKKIGIKDVGKLGVATMTWITTQPYRNQH